MEACNFGHATVVELLLAQPSLDIEAVNLRGQGRKSPIHAINHTSTLDIMTACFVFLVITDGMIYIPTYVKSHHAIRNA
jgi:hypothetical protein